MSEAPRLRRFSVFDGMMYMEGVSRTAFLGAVLMLCSIIHNSKGMMTFNDSD